MPDLPGGEVTQAWESMNEISAPEMVVQQNVTANFAPAASKTPGIPAKTEKLLDLNPEDDSSQKTREYLAITSRLASIKVSLAGKSLETAPQAAVEDTIPDAITDAILQEITPDPQDLAPQAESNEEMVREQERQKSLADPVVEWIDKASERVTSVMDGIKEKASPVLDKVEGGLGKAKDFMDHPLEALDGVRDKVSDLIGEGLDWLGLPNGEEDAPQGVLTPVLEGISTAAGQAGSWFDKAKEKATPLLENAQEKYDQIRDVLDNPLEILDDARDTVADLIHSGFDLLGIPNGEEEAPQGVLTPLLDGITGLAEKGSTWIGGVEEKVSPVVEKLENGYSQVKEAVDNPDDTFHSLVEQVVPQSLQPMLDALGLRGGENGEDSEGPLSFLSKGFGKLTGFLGSLIGKTEKKVKPVLETGKEKYDQAKEILNDPLGKIEEIREITVDAANVGMDRLGIPNGEEESPQGLLTSVFDTINDLAAWGSATLDKAEEKVNPLWESGKEIYGQVRDTLDHPLEALNALREILPEAASVGMDRLGIPNGEEDLQGLLTPLFDRIGQLGTAGSSLLQKGQDSVSPVIATIGEVYDRIRDIVADPFGSLREITQEGPAWIDELLDAVGIPGGNSNPEILPEEITDTPESVDIQPDTTPEEQPEGSSSPSRQLLRESLWPMRNLAAAATLPFLMGQPAAAMEELATPNEEMYAMEQAETIFGKNKNKELQDDEEEAGGKRSVYVDRICDQIVINVANTDASGVETIRYEIIKVLNEICEYEG